MADFEVKYTFGVEPLQQYLVELPGGRLQALTVAWDARPEAQVGLGTFLAWMGPRRSGTGDARARTDARA